MLCWRVLSINWWMCLLRLGKRGKCGGGRICSPTDKTTASSVEGGCWYVIVGKLLVSDCSGTSLCEGLQNGKTPLHLAARNGHELIVTYLVGQGADTEVRDNVSGGEALRLTRGCDVWTWGRRRCGMPCEHIDQAVFTSKIVCG